MRRTAILLALALALSACAAPMVQAPLTPPVGFTGPRIEDRAFIVRDGALRNLRASSTAASAADAAALLADRTGVHSACSGTAHSPG